MRAKNISYKAMIEDIKSHQVDMGDSICKLDDLRRRVRKIGKEIVKDADFLNGIDLNKRDEGVIDVIDMFSGCGGMSLGFKAISKITSAYKLVAAVDIDKDANDTYEKKYGIKPEQCNIETLVNDLEHFSSFVKKYRPDPSRPLVLIGCAPCQGFSSHQKGVKEQDVRNSLVEEFAKLAVKLNPNFIVMENVPELLSRKHWEHFSSFKEILEQKGYYVRAQIVNSAEYGVPQERYRAIVIASKQRFLMASGVLENKQFKTVRDAIDMLPKINPGEPILGDAMHVTANHKKSTIDVISQVPKDGGNRPKHIGLNWYQDVYGRLSWDKPSITITTNARNPASGRYVHPDQNRGLSIREAALLQSFPKDFIFEGNLSNAFTQIGNAVPPKLSTYLAIHLLGEFIGEPISNELFNVDKTFDIQNPIPNSFAAITKHAKKKSEVENLWKSIT